MNLKSLPTEQFNIKLTPLIAIPSKIKLAMTQHFFRACNNNNNGDSPNKQI